MSGTARLCACATLLLALSAGCAAPSPAAPGDPRTLSVLSWNIWHGGREDGEHVGPSRVVDVIRASGADVVALQETYGSGELLADALGFHFHPRGTNVSLLSRFPILEDVSVFEEFKCVGAVLAPPDGEPFVFCSLWLPYDAEIWEAGTRAGKPVDELLAACESSASDLAVLLAELEARLVATGYEALPVVVAGDFNSMSHLDYTSAARDQYEHAIDWPTSRVITDAGFRDTYREFHSRVDRARDRTWTPRFPEQSQDRIDFVYVDAPAWRVTEARVLDEHAAGFPSDHAAVLVRFSRR